MGPLIKHWVILSNPNPNYNLLPLDVSARHKLLIRFRIEVFAGRLIYYKQFFYFQINFFTQTEQVLRDYIQ